MLTIPFWVLVIFATCAWCNREELAKAIICLAVLALIFNVTFAFASDSPWVCKHSGAGQIATCVPK